MAKKKEEVVEPESIVEPIKRKEFVPVIYISKSKSLAITTPLPEDKLYQFNSNGYVGVYSAQSQKEVDDIEAHREYGREISRLKSGVDVPGNPSKVVVGVRSALTKSKTGEELDPKVAKIIEQSNIAAHRKIEEVSE